LEVPMAEGRFRGCEAPRLKLRTGTSSRMRCSVDRGTALKYRTRPYGDDLDECIFDVQGLRDSSSRGDWPTRGPTVWCRRLAIGRVVYNLCLLS
jgi:hypothetical protein